MGLIPCNVIPEEILTDHPKRFRAMFVESANPVHSLADSQRMREAFRALELSVVIDVAMTETAAQADYVLPASSQFEKAEATFFNLEFPRNGFHLRQPLFEPRPGTLPEAEIHARLVEALGELDDGRYRLLRRAAGLGMTAFGLAFAWKSNATSRSHATRLSCCTGARATTARGHGRRSGAVGHLPDVRSAESRDRRVARASVARRCAPATSCSKRSSRSPSGVVFAVSEYAESWQAVRHPGQRINLHMPELMPELASLEAGLPRGDTDYPFVLSAGERRSDTSNTSIRDPGVASQRALRHAAHQPAGCGRAWVARTATGCASRHDAAAQTRLSRFRESCNRARLASERPWHRLPPGRRGARPPRRGAE